MEPQKKQKNIYHQGTKTRPTSPVHSAAVFKITFSYQNSHSNQKQVLSFDRFLFSTGRVLLQTSENPPFIRTKTTAQQHTNIIDDFVPNIKRSEASIYFGFKFVF